MLVEYHRLAINIHQDLSTIVEIDEDAIGRCDTILNITSAEIERIDKERIEDLRVIAQSYLDDQISFHEQVNTTSSLVHDRTHALIVALS